MLNIGDVAVVKITGERVCILAFVDDVVQVRRAEFGPNDNINQYKPDSFRVFELETLEEQVGRQVEARLFQIQGQERLSVAEMEMSEKLAALAEEKEIASAGGTAAPKLAVVPKGKNVN